VSFDLEKQADGRVVFPGVDEAERRVEYLYVTREALQAAAADAAPSAQGPAASAKIIRHAVEKVLQALDNDLNTSVALSAVAELAKVGNEVVTQVHKQRNDPAAQAVSRSLAAAARDALDACCEPLGLMQSSSSDFFARARTRRLKVRGLDGAVIDAKVEARIDARAAKDFARGDAIRAELSALGIELQDVPGGGGTTWKVLI
jgi:cysteinyl-tRNA synthetase